MELEPFKSKKPLFIIVIIIIFIQECLPIEDVVIYPLELGGDPKEKIVELKIQFIKQLNFLIYSIILN